MSRARKLLPWKRNAVVAGLLAVLASACGGPPGAGKDDKNKKEDAPVPVTVVAAEQRTVDVVATALGTVAAQNTVTVSPQVGGQLMSLHFTEGGKVTKGQVLARIDARSNQASVAEAEAALRQTQAALATARANYERANSPAYRQYVSKTDLDTQRNEVTRLEAAVAAAQASLGGARVQLQYTTVTSPINGIAGIRNVDAGNVVAAGTGLVTITQTQPIQVVFNLPERQLGALRQARAAGSVPVEVAERGAAKVLASDGSLDVIDNQISADSGTFRARAVFANDNDALWPGQFVNVRLRLGSIDNAVVIPAPAIQRGPDGDFVYVVQDDAVRQQKVTVGIEVDDRHVQVSDGLKAGDRVVTEGQFRLKPGSKVIALAPGQAPPAPAASEDKEKKDEGGPRVTTE
ncbi:efflux RND transporter periplasmic adaptor subunit [Stenotrophomonas sp. W1S232]|uniref:Efflux RND transporter periplasmic adaptor subunit n=1 Tax=Stenotrophomonas koreensis TaxID=266128 RepID=A0A7W3V0K2_9GAMM|nr:efflux RND transporter periplasmic adaptor subunit [Stenotrophomonas koreensis]MBB1117279.1 efflux RND transporter periplasmic adaptor subunit [Stenotrophomonas koreensis]